MDETVQLVNLAYPSWEDTMSQKLRVRDVIALVIPVILLIFYVFAIGTAIASTILAARQCGTNAACAAAFHARRIEGVNLILNVVGGLVSALVVAELAITQPGDLPSAQILRRRPTRSATRVMTFVSTAFIFVWLLGGAVAVLMYLLYPSAIPTTLSEFSKAWLGLALASAYSYLGIK
jgi:Na+/phosphate symporter